jgi:hypothetical protein
MYPTYPYPPHKLMLKIHILLDFSWDELRIVFCSLRSLIDQKREGLIRNVPIVALDMAFSPTPLLCDLTCGCLRVMWKILSGEADKYFQ